MAFVSEDHTSTNKPTFRLDVRTATGILATVHFFGVIGLLIPLTRPWFEAATPFSLLLSAFLLFYFQRGWNTAFIFFMIFTFLAGYGIEVLGVKTRLIFGDYFYKTALGFKVLEVPPLIGINWLMLVYAAGVILHPLKQHFIIKSTLAAALMTGMDFFIEPVAITHNFWEWADQQVPAQNYLGWYLISFALVILFYRLPFHKTNPMAKYLIMVQIIFFLLLQIGHYYHD